MNGLDSHEMQIEEAEKRSEGLKIKRDHMKNSKGIQVGLIRFALFD